ncbi:MAG: DUF4380 domain-containing protein [Terriglobia bacterium]
MRIFATVLFLMSAALGATTAAPAQEVPRCSLEQTTYKGWKAIRLTNGFVTLTIAPEIGGRAIQYELGSHAYFFVNPELAGKVLPREQNDRGREWANYGGDKDWLGPQGFDTAEQWAGPPDYNLDGSVFSAEVAANNAEEVAVRVTAPPDDRSGLQLSRVYRLARGSTRVAVEHHMKNITGHNVRWGFQEVTQSDTADPSEPLQPNHDVWVFTPANPRSRFPGGYTPQHGDVRDSAYQPLEGFFRLHYRYQALQVGVDSEAGWLAVANGKTQHAFVQRFRFVPGADYPDQCTIEFWLNGPERYPRQFGAPVTEPGPRHTPYYLETEIISPYFFLRPGEDASFQTEWFAARGLSNIVNVTDAGVTSEPLAARVEGTMLHVTGAFGVFYPGTVALSLKGSGGEELKRISLGRVTPDALLRVDQEIEAPPATHRISLELRDDRGLDRGDLGNLVFNRN